MEHEQFTKETKHLKPGRSIWTLPASYVFLYLAAIVTANLLVTRFGPGVSILNAFLLIGLDLTARDRLHDLWRGRRLFLNMAALIMLGSVLSYHLNRDAGRVATASLVSFLLAGAVDALAYHLLGERSRLEQVNGSNTAGAVVDSLVFPLVAFGWPLLIWVSLGQFAAKLLGGFVWFVILERLRKPADVL